MKIHTREMTFIMPCSLGQRFASCLINDLSKVESSIKLCRPKGCMVDAKSLIGVLSLRIDAGEKIMLKVLNENEEKLEKDCEKIMKIME